MLPACQPILKDDVLGIMSFNDSVPVSYKFGIEGSHSIKVSSPPSMSDTVTFDALRFPFNFAAAMAVDIGIS